MIFDTIFVKARWERWCDLRVINARKKKAFSVVPKASPWRPNHVTICLLRLSGESLHNGQLELRRRNWYFARVTHKDTAVSVWACQAGFWNCTRTSCQLRSKPHTVLRAWGLRNRTHWSARYTNGRNAGRLRGSSCIVIPGVVCELLQFAVTQHAGIVNLFVDHTHTQFTE